MGVVGVVKKPVQGAKHGGAKGFLKGLGKGFLGLVGRPASGVADLTSTSFKLIKKFVFLLYWIDLDWSIRVATNEEVIHRVRNPRHIGRDGLVRPSIPHETLGNFIFNVCFVYFNELFSIDSFRNWVKNIVVKMKVISHILIHQQILDVYSLQQQSQFFYLILINCWLIVSRRMLLLVENVPLSNEYRIEWDYHYKEMKGQPTVKFQPNIIEITFKVMQFSRQFFENLFF